MINFLRKIIPRPLILFYHKFWAILGNIFYRFPGRKLYVIGVTGTNGKTTTCNLITSILEEAGYKVGMTSTVYFQIGGKRWLNQTKMTVPGYFFFPKILKKMVNNNCQYAVLEISSHAIDQFRCWGIPFDAAVITNVTHDHLDYHKSFNDYRRTKGKLFASLYYSFKKKGMPKISIVNADDSSFQYFAQFWANKKIAYTIKNNKTSLPQIEALNIKSNSEGVKFILKTPKDKIDINLKLRGEFNVANACAAASLAFALGIDTKTIKKGLEKIKEISGRMEEVYEGQNFKVIVDYAHTPDAFQKVFESVIKMPHNKIISVFGATGDRDRQKRPILGEIAAKFSDYIILTLEDPGSEDPAEIIKEIEPGVIKKGKKFNKDYYKIVDRRKAIKKAFHLAQKNDIVLLLAKGHEQVMQMKNKKVPWDDRIVARQELKILLNKK